MRIVVDTSNDITQLFKIISDVIRTGETGGVAVLDNFITVTAENRKIKYVLAEAIAQFIIKKFERKMAFGYIKEFELLKSETEEILNVLWEDAELRQKRMNLIKKEVASYISTGHINVDGVVAFRLEQYKEELRFTVELLVDEMSVKKSYDEFIGLMKYFTEIQEPVTDTVVLTENSGEYSLTDVSGNPIDLRFDEEFADELMPIGLSGEDILISNLMAAMPRKIIFKDLDRGKPVINTISRIFEGRISY